MLLTVDKLYKVVNNMMLDKEVVQMHESLCRIQEKSIRGSVLVLLNSAGTAFGDLFVGDGAGRVIYLYDRDGRVCYKYGSFKCGPITDDVLRRFPLTPEGEAFVKRFL